MRQRAFVTSSTCPSSISDPWGRCRSGKRLPKHANSLFSPKRLPRSLTAKVSGGAGTPIWSDERLEDTWAQTVAPRAALWTRTGMTENILLPAFPRKPSQSKVTNNYIFKWLCMSKQCVWVTAACVCACACEFRIESSLNLSPMSLEGVQMENPFFFIR